MTAHTGRRAPRERRQVSELMLRAERAFDEARTAARALDMALGPGTGDELMAAVAQAIRGAHAGFVRERGGQAPVSGAGESLPNAQCLSAGDGQRVGNRAGGAPAARAPRASSTGPVDPWSATPSGGVPWTR